MRRWLGVVGVFVLLACQGPQSRFQCKGGDIVDAPENCPELQGVGAPPPASAPPATPPPVADQAVAPELSANASAQAPEAAADVSKPNATGQLYISLNGWSVEEILRGMSAYEPKIGLAKFTQVIYVKPAWPQYRLGNKNKLYEDPFFILRAPFNGRSKEDPAFYHLRIDVPQPPSHYQTYVSQKRSDSKFKLIYPEQWAEFERLECRPEPSCRQIEAVRCSRDGNATLFIWTHNATPVGYTEDTKYTMMSQDDGRTLLSVFEKFYCTPI